VRVMVVDDSLLVREGLIALLAVRGHDVVDVADNPAAVPALVRVHTPDVVLVDIKMPPTYTDEGLRLAAGIRSRHPETGVLVLSQYLVASYAALLLDRSPERVGYLLKDNVLQADVLEDAMQRVAGGGTFIDPMLVARMVKADASLAVLSDREREVLGLMAEGHTNAGIAERLVVTDGAIEKHVRSIFQKLGMPATDAHNRRVLAVLTYLGV